jgi:hypothetical protein
MNSRKLLEKNPLSANVIKEWFLNKLLESIKRDDTVPQDFKDYVLAEGITDEKVAIFIDSNPRSLFDVFDENDIIIYSIIFSTPEGIKFSGAIHTGNGEIKPNPIGKQYDIRKEAELFAVEAAFELLEQQLKEKENGEIISGTDSSDN